VLALKQVLKINTISKGFTLIELMVTLAIAAMLLVVAVPSMVTFKRNAELTSATNTLLSAINAARGEAMKRGMNAMVVPTDNGTDWNKGWVVFVDNSTTYSQAYESADDITVLTQGAMPSYLTVTGNGTAGYTPSFIKFDASGYSKDKMNAFPGNLTLNLVRNDATGSDVSKQTRRIIISATGRARTCMPASANDSTCLAASSE